ncbi:MAG: 4'-phosphopantetheinyl transferase superfamily protein [Gammaproteobacteria bacterium]|nr:4'-phosphopantetheinyl transferase superfamily protein [Gammaproteobacteria bacterium]
MPKINKISSFDVGSIGDGEFQSSTNNDAHVIDPVRAVSAYASHKNPARISPLVASVFPAGVTAAELRLPGDPALLFPAETLNLTSAVPRRIQEFSAGRLCARRALTQLGFADHPLLMGGDRRPQWPSSVVGSITHTAGICAVAVAARSQFQAIGLDMEIVGHVSPEMWSHVCTSEETAWLKMLPEPEQTRYATLIFSAKEAFYKCQYELTQQWLEFDDIILELPAPSLKGGDFLLLPRRRIDFLKHKAVPWRGQFRFHENFVVTGIALTAC